MSDKSMRTGSPFSKIDPTYQFDTTNFPDLKRRNKATSPVHVLLVADSFVPLRLSGGGTAGGHTKQQEHKSSGQAQAVSRRTLPHS